MSCWAGVISYSFVCARTAPSGARSAMSCLVRGLRSVYLVHVSRCFMWVYGPWRQRWDRWSKLSAEPACVQVVSRPMLNHGGSGSARRPSGHKAAEELCFTRYTPFEGPAGA